MARLEPILYQRPKQTRLMLRALWHDTRALVTEFRASLLAFLLLSFLGGALYGELYTWAGHGFIAWIDRPYIIMQLMIFEAPHDIPAEWYLIIFWYLLPLAFILIIGNGAADFVRLFFNRSARRGWKEAVIKMYQNHVVLLGAGHVGLRVARILNGLGVLVVVVDNEPEAEVLAELDTMGIRYILGDGRREDVLSRTGIANARSFIACTGVDHVNFEVVMRARAMNDKLNIVVRVWDDQFADQLKSFMRVQSVVSSSAYSAPAFAGLAFGADLTQQMEIGDKIYSTVRLVVAEGSFLCRQTVGTLQDTYEIDVVLHEHQGDAKVKPARERVVMPGDTIVVFATHEQNLALAVRNSNGEDGRG